MKPRLLVPLLLLAGLALRLAWPLADPPATLSWSTGLYTDPVANILPARYALEEGAWDRFPAATRLVYPLLNGLAWAAYRALGVGVAGSRLLAVLLGVATVALLGWALRRGPGRVAALVGTGLGSVAFFLVAFSRLPMAEAVAAPLLTASCGFALGASPRARAAAGALAAAAVLAGKLNAIGFVPGLAVFLFLRGGGRALGAATLGAAGVAALWGVVVWLPHRTELLAAAANSSLAGGTPGGPFAAFRDAWMFHRLPLLAAAGGLFALWTVFEPAARRRRVADGSALFAFWFVGQFAYHSLLPYSAPRYWLLAAVPLVAAAACLFREAWEADAPRPASRVGLWVAAGIWTAFAGFGVANATFHYELVARREWAWESTALGSGLPAWSAVTRLDSLPENLAAGAIVALLLLPVTAWAVRRLSDAHGSSARGGSVRDIPGPRTRRAAVALLSLSIAVQLFQWSAWAAGRTGRIEAVKEELAAIVGPDAIVLSPFAPLLTEGTEVLPVATFGRVDAGDPAAPWKAVTHVLVAQPGHEGEPGSLFPEHAGEIQPVHQWTVSFGRARTLQLFRLPRGAAGGGAQPTAFERAIDAVRTSRWPDAAAALAAHRSGGGAETADLLLYEAMVALAAGDVAGGRARLERALVRDPHHVGALRTVTAVAERQGDRAGARAFARRGLRLDPRDDAFRAAAGAAPAAADPTSPGTR